MGKSTPSAPAAPDPTETAAAQAAANKETAQAQAELNMINQYTPGGSLEYTQRGVSADGTPQYSATQTLSDEGQQILDLQNQASIGYGQIGNSQLNQVSDTLSTPIDFSTLGDAPQANQQAWDTAYNSLIQRNQPQADQQLQAIQTQLANQGIGIGSEAYDNELARYSSAQNDFGLAAQNAAMGQMSQQYALDSAARNQAINERVSQRQIPLNELSALATGTQLQSPSFGSTPQTGVAGTPVADSIYGSYNAEQQNYQNALAQQQAEYSALGNLAGVGTAFAFSDKRLKKNITKIGKLLNGLAVYTYDYIWGGPRQTGLMAHEVYEVNPDAVIVHDGYLMVNYEEAVKCPTH